MATPCRDVSQFVRAFHRHCEGSAVFISHARRSVGEVVAFSFELADGSPALAGLGAVIEQFTNADNRFGRPGVLIALHRLSRGCRRVFEELSAAHAAAEGAPRREPRDLTPLPLAESRGVTSAIQLFDHDALTPVPQLPPRAPAGSSALPKAPVDEAPDAKAGPAARPPRTRTRPIAMIANQPGARAPAVMKIPGIVPARSDAPLPLEPPKGTAEIAPVVAEAMPPPVAEAMPPPVAPPPPQVAPAFAAEPPLPAVAPAFAAEPPPPLDVAPARWTPRRIWAVAALAGASLLALGIVIGAKFVAGGPGDQVAPPAAAARSAAAAAPVPPPAEPMATAAATPPSPPEPVPPPPEPAPMPPAAAPPRPEPASAPVAKAPPPARVVKVAAAVPAKAAAPIRAKPPAKKPAHAAHRGHAAAPPCSSLSCL